MRTSLRRRAVMVAVALAVLLAPVAGVTVAGEWQARREQAGLLAELEQAEPPATTGRPARGSAARSGHPVARPAAPGEPLAVLEIPRFGADWRWAVVEGTDEESLARGPGHYAGTPLFGDRGNVGVAGHRAGHGSPFLDFDRLRVGDQVRVRQRGVTWTYRITRAPRVVDVDDTWVLDPVRGRRLTLTTCWPKYGSSRRMYAVARLAGVEQVRPGGATPAATPPRS